MTTLDDLLEIYRKLLKASVSNAPDLNDLMEQYKSTRREFESSIKPKRKFTDDEVIGWCSRQLWDGDYQSARTAMDDAASLIQE